MSFNSIACPCISTVQLLGAGTQIVNAGAEMQFKSLVANRGIAIADSPTTLTFSTNFQHGNVAFIDGRHGDDAIAERESVVMSYRTIPAAISAFSDTIYIRAGTYANIAPPSNKIYYFESGCVLRNFAFSGETTVLGYGDFRQTNTQLFAGRGIFFCRRIVDNSANDTFACTGATYINAEYSRKRNSGALFASSSGSSSAKIQWVTCSTECARGNFNLEIDRLFLSGSADCFRGAISLRSNRLQYNGSGILFTSGTIHCIVDNLVCRGYFSDTRGTLAVQSSRITFTTNLGANAVIRCRSNGRIAITAPEIRYRIPNLMDFIDCRGRLQITGSISALQTPQIGDFVTAFGRVTLNCPELNIWGMLRSGTDLQIRSDRIIFHDAAIVSTGTCNINARVMEISQPSVINGGAFTLHVERMDLTTIFANIFGGEFRIEIDNLTSDSPVLDVIGATGQFGGIWTTTAALLVNVNAGSLTILPSKFVSVANSITSVTPINIMCMPSIANVGGFNVTFIGSMTVDPNII